jgi:hypothetical protein
MFGLPYCLVFGRDTEHPLLQVLVAQLQELALPNIFLHCDNQGHFEKVLAVVVLAVIRCWCRMLLVGIGEHVLACDILPIISSEKQGLVVGCTITCLTSFRSLEGVALFGANTSPRIKPASFPVDRRTFSEPDTRRVAAQAASN